MSGDASSFQWTSSFLFGWDYVSLNEWFGKLSWQNISLLNNQTSDLLHSLRCYCTCTVDFACQISFQLNISLTKYWRSNLVWRTSVENLLDFMFSGNSTDQNVLHLPRGIVLLTDICLECWSGGGTSTSLVRGCVATGSENWPIRRLKLAHQ